MALGVASGQCNLLWSIMTNLGHITGPLWKHPFINTIVIFIFCISDTSTVDTPKGWTTVLWWTCMQKMLKFHTKGFKYWTFGWIFYWVSTAVFKHCLLRFALHNEMQDTRHQETFYTSSTPYIASKCTTLQYKYL